MTFEVLIRKTKKNQLFIFLTCLLKYLSGESQTLVSANFCCCLRPDLLLSRMFSYKAQQVVKLRITSYCSSSQCFIFNLEYQRGNKFINGVCLIFLQLFTAKPRVINVSLLKRL